ncbi:class I SAM-dependent methyltransferase [Lysinibacillus macroides]|uniref:Methylase n=1 Tax=Lysinibacillus macroides TaxID=33935 RepID=A0A0N0CUR4_9BACI|nr:class I SAM-dependent methyltransferase [Lysinibacillus macroides]KOY80571.1 methylase [Lysinibacillus macroides]QPR69707.1 class I SAM-dependent methyltransferase [Lysinibacillus macroides]
MKNDATQLLQKSQAYENNARISVPGYDTLFSMVQAYFRAQLGEQQASILIVGAGGGNELSAWGQSNSNWSFTGVDPSEEMLQIASYKAEQLQLESRVQLLLGTIDHLPSADTKFDAASCILVLHFIEEWQEKLALLQNIHGQLKPGKPFALVSAFGQRDSAELQDRIKIWQSFFLDVGYPQAKVKDMGKVIMNISFISDQQIEQLLKEAGFQHIARFFTSGLFAGWMCHA